MADVRKSLHFCRQVGMDVAGIVENMSGFVCPDCGSVHHIFKTGGGEKMAREWDINFLGKIPLDPAVVEAADEGQSILEINSSARGGIESVVNNLINSLEDDINEPGVIPRFLAQQGVNVVLAGGMGERAQAIFRQNGIKVVCGVVSGTPEQIVKDYLSDNLVTSINPCTHEEGHSCGGER